jgi:hypothetical protein
MSTPNVHAALYRNVSTCQNTVLSKFVYHCADIPGYFLCLKKSYIHHHKFDASATNFTEFLLLMFLGFRNLH